MKKLKPGTGQSAGRDLHSQDATHSSSRSRIPALLFEGDEDALAKVGSDDQPESTSKLLLMARDPYSIYAHWDLTASQKRQSLILKVHREHAGGPLAATVPVAPESNHAFVQVADAGTQYVAQLGHSDESGSWTAIATSSAVTTPPRSLSLDRTAEFGQMPPASPRFEVSSTPVQETETKITAKPSSRDTRLIPLVPPPNVSWTPSLPTRGEQPGETNFEKNYWRELLASSGDVLEAGMNYPALPGEESFSAETGSIDLEQLLQTAFAQLNFGDSSFLGDVPAISPNFFLTIATELIVHGATHPNARVSISGSPLDVRPDGTFTCHFALVDGELSLNVKAVSTDGDSRRAGLRVMRQSK
jgi:hypothetical protein